MSTTRGIDFWKLSLQDALDLAVLIEEEAKERYEEFASQMEAHHTPEAARFFRFMSSNEEKHRAELAERRAELFGKAAPRVTRTQLFDVEAPDYDEARVFMTAREALEAALRSEEKARMFFESVLPQVADRTVVTLFEGLRDEELAHRRLVERELAKLPPDESFKVEDFADEPVAQ